jgi:ribonucleoside-diphosphate reductase alpha chain
MAAKTADVMPIGSPSHSLYVRKRNGELEKIDYNKINNRIEFLCRGELQNGTIIGKPLDICYDKIVISVISSIKNGITTQELDILAAKICINHIHEDIDFGQLGARIAVSNHQKTTLNSFYKTMDALYHNKDKNNQHAPLLTREFYNFVKNNAEELESFIDYKRDYQLDYFGHMTLFESYLLRTKMGSVGPGEDSYLKERAQHLYMRIAVALYMNVSMEKIKETYDILSKDGGYVSHATPTMYNAGAPLGQLASCFLTGMEDSMDAENGIPDLWNHCAKISKRAGGIGICLSNIRCSGSLIRGTNGNSSGIVPLCKVFNDISRYVNQGGKRNGSFAVYLEPWHGDIEVFIQLKKNHGVEDARARDLFLALWIPDLFMKRLIEAYNENKPVVWSLMCPDQSFIPGGPRLYDVHSEDFEKLYLTLEKEKLYVKQIEDIRELWKEIIFAQQETGVPYILYKDHINNKNNQANLGTIRCSNLCAEIVEYSSPDEHSVCNLASVALQRFVKYDESGLPYYDFAGLQNICYKTLINLDRIIDITFYPTKFTRKSNFRHRPVGLGVQGLADAFILMRFPFESPEAAKLNRQIFETIYFACMSSSKDLAKMRYEFINGLEFEPIFAIDTNEDTDLALNLGNFNLTRGEWLRAGKKYVGSYSTFEGSPLSLGKFQFDLWTGTVLDSELNYDWESLRAEILKYGVRNSLTTAVMPTASTASILRSVECIEPLKSNIYTRRILKGEFVNVNTYLQNDLKNLGLWNKQISKKIMEHRGGIQFIHEIPISLRQLYKTAYEIKKKCIIDLAKDRGPFIDQTQSMNLFFEEPTIKDLTSSHIYSWKVGLKTGMYYLRRMPATNAAQFVLEGEKEECTSCSA